MGYLPPSGSRHHPPPAGKQPTPLLTRCKSVNQATSPPFASITSNNPTTFTKSRSISITKTRNHKEPEFNHFMTSDTSPIVKKKQAQDVGTKILPRRKATSPSAWALSPGRVAPCPSPVPVKPPSRGGKSTGGGISGVFKYFRQRKAVSSSEESDVQRFKFMSNMLVQWRFGNARAEATMSTVKVVAEKQMFNAWLNILVLRNSNMVKRMEVQKLKNSIRLYHVMYSQMFLLEKWSKMEARNFEAVGRVVRKLTVASLNIPMLHDSKGDVSVVNDVLDTADALFTDIESMVTTLSDQAEKTCYQLTELSIIAKQEHESLAELQTWMTVVALLKEKERSLQAHLMQTR